MYNHQHSSAFSFSRILSHKIFRWTHTHWMGCSACSDLFIRWLDEHTLRSDLSHSQSSLLLLGGLMMHIVGWSEMFDTIVCQYYVFNTIPLKCRLWCFKELYLCRCNLKIVYKRAQCQTERHEGVVHTSSTQYICGHPLSINRRILCSNEENLCAACLSVCACAYQPVLWFSGRWLLWPLPAGI